MAANNDTIETDSAVCALIYKAIRDAEKRNPISINYSNVQNVLDYYLEACDGQKDISSLVADIHNAKNILTQFKDNDYTIMQVKKIAEDAIEPSQVRLVEEQQKQY